MNRLVNRINVLPRFFFPIPGPFFTYSQHKSVTVPVASSLSLAAQTSEGSLDGKWHANEADQEENRY